MGRDEGDYARMITGDTVLQFATESAAPTGGVTLAPHRPGHAAAAMQLCLGVPDVPAAYEQAVGAGATEVAAPVTKPWGQVGYARDPDGVLVKLSTPGG